MVDELRLGERINGRHHMVIEAKKQLWLSGPLIIANILEKLIQVVSLMFVGHLGELPLSGASMAVSFASVTVFSLLVNIYIHIFFYITLFILCLFLLFVSCTRKTVSSVKELIKTNIY